MTGTQVPLVHPGGDPRRLDPAELRTPAELTAAIGSCTRCPLADDRISVVPGTAPEGARIMVLGRSPGRQEDVQGVPFLGAVGNVLDHALSRAGLTRDDVVLTTLVKCHPPGDRQPSALELETCLPWLLEQLATLRPEVVVSLGELPTAALLRRRIPFDRLVGHRLTILDGITVLPCRDPMAAVRGSSLVANALQRALVTAAELVDEAA